MKLETGADRRQRGTGGSMIYPRTSALLSPVSQIYSTEDMGADPRGTSDTHCRRFHVINLSKSTDNGTSVEQSVIK